MNPDGTDRQVLLDNGVHYTLVGWSPKHDRLAVIRSAERPTLDVLDVTTGAFTTLVDREGVLPASADWSPDGKWIVYSASKWSGPTIPEGWYNLRLVRPDGTDDHELPVHACRPSWSSDSRRVAAVMCAGVPDNEPNVVVADADGTGSTMLPGLHVQDPSWSPRQDLISGTHPDGSLMLFRPDGSDVRSLSSGTPMSRPAWTTDGTRLIYANREQDSPVCGTFLGEPCTNRTYGLYSIAIDGSGEIRLTSDTVYYPVMPRR